MMTKKSLLLTLILCLGLFTFGTFINAQDTPADPIPEATPEAEPQRDPFTLSVFVDSAFLRALPDFEAEPVGSVFENDVLEAVGRNADGTWFQVRRPGRQAVAGWITRAFVAFGGDVATLPITDLTTGVIGPEPVFDTGFAAFVLTEASLRATPFRDVERVAVVPIRATIPVSERTADNLWFHVNYLGFDGWVAEFLVSINGNVEAIPIASFGDSAIVLPQVPIEVQLAQVARLRAYILPKRDLASEVANFWSLLQRDEIIPCAPPGGGFTNFAWTQQDVYELPELRRYVRRLDIATPDLNQSINAMEPCGVYTPEQISSAYANAINARVIYNAVLDNLDFLETEVILRNP